MIPDFPLQLKAFNSNIIVQSLVRQTEMSIRGRRHKQQQQQKTKNSDVKQKKYI